MAFNLVLSETQEALLKQVMSLCDLSSKKEAVENALTLLGWAAIESAKGHSIASVDEKRKSYQEITTPALQNARMKAKLERAKQPAHA
jgi:hypothetical protein